jgi:hypothetical protein
VSQRLGTLQFCRRVLQDLFSTDLPVFLLGGRGAARVAPDLRFDAWRNWRENVLGTHVWKTMIQAMIDQYSNPYQAQRDCTLTNSQPTNFFRSGSRLITGIAANSKSQQIFTLISNSQPASINILGSDRVVDFSQFQVRGHYLTSQRPATILSDYDVVQP